MNENIFVIYIIKKWLYLLFYFHSTSGFLIFLENDFLSRMSKFQCLCVAGFGLLSLEVYHLYIYIYRRMLLNFGQSNTYCSSFYFLEGVEELH